MTWTAEKKGQAVVIRFPDVTTGWRQEILLSSDRHHDSPHTDNRLELRHLQRALAIDAPIIDNGDLFDAMQSRHDPRRSHGDKRQAHEVDAYFDAILDEAEIFYGPFAHQFALLSQGNHETSVIKNAGIDLASNLARRLREAGTKPWPYVAPLESFVILQLEIHKTRRQRIIIYRHHGWGGAAPVTKGVIQSNRRAVMVPDADVVITGHTHEGWILPLERLGVSQQGIVRQRSQWHISIPSYKNDRIKGAGWATEKGHGLKPMGAAWLELEWVDGQQLAIRPRLDIL